MQIRQSFLVSILVLMVDNCKPADPSQSEDKGLGNLLKKGSRYLSKGGKLSDESLSNIKKLAKKSDPSVEDATIRELRQILQKSGDKADEAVLAYTRAYDERLLEWSGELSALRKTYSLSMRIELPKEQMLDLLGSINRSYNRLSDIVRDRAFQAERLVLRGDITKTTVQMNDLALGGFGIGKELTVKKLKDGSYFKEIAFPEELAANMRFLQTIKKTEELALLNKTEEHIIESLSKQADIQKTVEARLKRLGR